MKLVEMMANNQFILEHRGNLIFQSYGTFIALCEVQDDGSSLMIVDEYDYSKTTKKYLKRFKEWCNHEETDKTMHNIFLVDRAFGY